jgi:hypothetical protein
MAVGTTLSAAPPAPPPPDKYDVFIRYRIDAFRNQRVPQYRELMEFLKKAGFERVDEDVDPNEPADARFDHVRGTISSSKARRLLAQRHIETIRLQPAGSKIAGADPIRIQVELASGLAPARQRELQADVRRFLGKLGFVEGVGYDERGHSRLVGSIPADKLDQLLEDVRLNPAAWSLLKKTLLVDLRSAPSGVGILEKILEDWREHSDGRKWIDTAIDQWRRNPAADEVLATLPKDPTIADRTVLRERLFLQMIHHRDAAAVLTTLFENVLKEKSAPELLASLFRRIRGQTVTEEMPLLYRVSPAIRVVEVFPGMPLPPTAVAAPRVPVDEMNLSEDMRAFLAGAAPEKRIRFEVLLAETPADDSVPWRGPLARMGLRVEGRVGPLVTVVGLPAQVKEAAAMPDVVSVRLPRPARPQPVEGLKPIPADPLPLKASGVVKLHMLGCKGKGTRIAIVDSDFRNWEAYLGKGLPKTTKMIDLTVPRNDDLKPDAFEGDPEQRGLGTVSALAVHKTAPEAELTLIRIDGAAPYMLQTVASAINGGSTRSLLALDDRLEELDRTKRLLNARQDKLILERKVVLESVGDDDESRKRLKEYEDRQKQYDSDLAEYRNRVKRYLDLDRDLRGLKGVRIVTSGLVWNEGYPVDGGSALTRYFDDRAFGAALWFQSAGDTRGQAWAGMFRDVNNNGIMEFGPPVMTRAEPGPQREGKAKEPEENWTPELNFLAWQPRDGKRVLDLPAGVTIRLSLQWREPHEADVLKAGEDPYREPLFEPRLVLFHQLDPEGKKQPADDLAIVAQSSGTPMRLEQTRSSAIYEQTVTLKVPTAGRYAIRIIGQLPESIRPRGAPTLPGVKKFGDLKPRLFVQTLTGAGRAVLRDYVTDAGTLGMPADSRRVLTTGAADRDGKTMAYSATGSPFNMDLLAKPDLLAYDDGDEAAGTALASAFAAGTAASSHCSGASLGKWMQDIGLRQGTVLRLPEGWPRRR